MDFDYGKISVIVPIYNMEKYLKKCLDSIVGQSYKNLEIILINDGSTDNCGKICTSYQKMDGRIKVINKKNEGVSLARNAGLKIATGKYLGFVDSDDWLESTMYESLVKALVYNKCEISIGGYYLAKNKKIIKTFSFTDKKVLEKNTALKYLIGDEVIKSYLCNKLFRKELFTKLEFSKTTKFEDFQIMHKLFYKASKIAFVSKPLYYYLYRDNSRSNSNCLRSRLEFVKVNFERFYFIKKKCPKLLLKEVSRLIYVSLGIFYHTNLKDWQKDELVKLRRLIYEDATINKYSKDIPLQLRLLYNLFKYYPRGYKALTHFIRFTRDIKYFVFNNFKKEVLSDE